MAVIVDQQTKEKHPDGSESDAGSQSENEEQTRHPKRLSQRRYWEGEDKSVKCYNCNGVGHMAFDCVEAKKERGSKCYECGEVGHNKVDCPKRKSLCYECGEAGHNKADCPKRKDTRVCYVCGEAGHLRIDCPKLQRCDNCDARGHNSDQCTKRRRRDVQPAVTWCQDNRPDATLVPPSKPSHIQFEDSDQDDALSSRDPDAAMGTSPEAVPKMTTLRERSTIYCCNCGKDGHVVEECSEPKMAELMHKTDSRTQKRAKRDRRQSEPVLSRARESETPMVQRPPPSPPKRRRTMATLTEREAQIGLERARTRMLTEQAILPLVRHISSQPMLQPHHHQPPPPHHRHHNTPPPIDAFSDRWRSSGAPHHVPPPMSRYEAEMLRERAPPPPPPQYAFQQHRQVLDSYGGGFRVSIGSAGRHRGEYVPEPLPLYEMPPKSRYDVAANRYEANQERERRSGGRQKKGRGWS
eukprot:c1842_g1_i1.p1 GENE.c1842_g1_i1~~c1842_g1_i1.p1  ORF type:complete len:467 (+),score=89.00 c1842_g1_i1:159-1559(+)